MPEKNSSNTPDAILKLSGLMRFMLGECTATTIPISKEIDLIRDYIELEKLRYDNRLDR
ncbi:MAG: histidine kinase [Saprospiraceae bacterium]